MKCVVNLDARGFVAAERALHLASTPYSTSRDSINNTLVLASNPSFDYSCYGLYSKSNDNGNANTCKDGDRGIRCLVSHSGRVRVRHRA
jgi:hypothetical protein